MTRFLLRQLASPRRTAALLVLATLTALWGTTRVEISDIPADLFRADDEVFRLLDQVQRDFSTDENDCLLVVEGDLFSSRGAKSLRAFVRRAQKIKGVDSVFSVAQLVRLSSWGIPSRVLPSASRDARKFSDAKKLAVEDPLASALLSADGRATMVLVRLPKRALRLVEVRPVVDAVRKIADEELRSSDFEVLVTGIPPVRLGILDSIKNDQQLMTIGGTIVSAAITLFLFRSFTALFIVGVGPLIGLLWTFGAVGIFGVEMDMIGSIVPTLVLVVGFTDSVHIVLDFRRNRGDGLSPRDAAIASVRHLGLACAVTSLTTAIGFGSLVVAEVESIQRFGKAAALGAFLTFLSVVLVVPLVAMTPLGKNLLPPKKAERSRRWAKWLEGAIAGPVVRYPRYFALAGVLLTLGLGAVSTQLQPENQLTESIPRHFEAFRAIRRCDELFDGVLEAQVLIEWDDQPSIYELLDEIAAAEVILGRSEHTGRTLSIANLYRALPAFLRFPIVLDRILKILPEDAVTSLYRADLQRTLVRSRVKDLPASVLEPDFIELENEFEKLRKQRDGVNFRLTGTVVVVTRKVNGMILELAKSLAFAAVLIFGVMALTFRSFKLGLISLIPNVLPMVAAGSALVALDWPLYLGMAMVFSVSLGVAVDDTIHFVSRYQRELATGASPEDAVRASFRTIGAALVVTSAVFVGGFSCTLLSEIEVLARFGILASVAFLAALPGDLVILPALLLLVDGKGRKTDESKESGDESGVAA
ncbi:MAG: MMPL family transporter [Planctomycetota bacterium]